MMVALKAVEKILPAIISQSKATVVIAAVLVFLTLASSAGCGGSARSENYFALAPGNSWLYEGVTAGSGIEVEIKAVKPDPSPGLREGVLDLAITGSMGNFAVSEYGLFLEAGSQDVKLWGVRDTQETSSFFPNPYVWLQKPLEVGREYHTAIQGTPTPALMIVTGKGEELTPFGEKEAFFLEEKSGSGPAGGVRLSFVPYLGFTKIAASGWPELKIKDASLR